MWNYEKRTYLVNRVDVCNRSITRRRSGMNLKAARSGEA